MRHRQAPSGSADGAVSVLPYCGHPVTAQCRDCRKCRDCLPNVAYESGTACRCEWTWD